MTRPSFPVRLGAHAVTWGAAALVFLPLFWMLTTSLKGDTEAISPDVRWLPAGAPTTWAWGNFTRAWTEASLGRFYLNSFLVASVVTVLSVAHNALAAYAFAKCRFRGRGVTFVLTIATMLLPIQVWFIFAYVICGVLGYVDHLHALIVPFLASAFGIFYLRQAIHSVPDSLLEAGRLDGMGETEAFGAIVVPLVRPALAALAIFTFMASWNAFFWPLIVIDREECVTLPLAIGRLAAGYYVPSWPVQMAAAAIMTLPTIVVFLLFHRSISQGLALTGGKR